MALSYETAVEVVKNLLGAVDAIKAREAELRDAAKRLAESEHKANAINAQIGEASRQLRDIEQQLAEKRSELEVVTKKFEEVYEAAKSAEGRLSVARQQLEALRQHVAG